MFTGIVEELGLVDAVEQVDGSIRVHVRAPLVTSDAREGDSVAVDGVCLTVTSVSDGAFTADVMPETLRRSSLADVGAGRPVNLERAATLATRLGGHVVQGHVDATGHILERRDSSGWTDVRVAVPDGLTRYIVEKGSIALDGVSLTVVDVTEDTFSVSLIPTTLERTTLGRKQAGDTVNVEVDILGKYVERLLQSENRPTQGSMEKS